MSNTQLVRSGLPYKVLDFLMAARLRSVQTSELTGETGPLHHSNNAQRHQVITKLVSRGLAERTSDHGIQITPEGVIAMRALMPPAQSSTQPGAVRRSTVDRVYSEGSCDAPLVLRPGALDHTRCASLIGGRLVPYQYGRVAR